MLKHIRITPRGIFGLIIAFIMLYDTLPGLIAHIYSGEKIDCQFYAENSKLQEAFLPVTLKNCSFGKQIVRLEQNSDTVFVPLDYDTWSSIFVRLNANSILPSEQNKELTKDLTSDITIYSLSFELMNNEDEIQSQLNIKRTPIVIADVHSTQTFEYVMQLIFILIAVAIVAGVVYSSLSRARDKATRELIESSSSSHDFVFRGDTEQVFSLSTLSNKIRRSSLLMTVIQAILGFVVLILLIDLMPIDEHSLFKALNIFGLAFCIITLKRSKFLPRVKGQFIFLLLMAYVIAITGYDIVDSLNSNKNDVTSTIMQNLLVSSIMIILLGLAYRAYRNMGDFKINEISHNYFSIVEKYKSAQHLEQLMFIKRIFLPGRFSFKGVSLIFLAMIVFLVTSAFAVVTGPAAIGFAFVFSLYFVKKAKARMLPDAREVLKRDPRAPVLLLRAFMDDESTIEGAFNVEKRFEEVLMKMIADLGPPVGIGDPKESIPKFGAYRTYCDDSNWQAQATSWMLESRFIIMISGKTEMLGWEFHKIIDNGLLDKLIYILPPESPELRLSRWDGFARHLEGTIFERAAQNFNPEATTAIKFKNDGTILRFTSNDLKQIDYLVTIQYFVSMMPELNEIIMGSDEIEIHIVVK